MNEKLLIIDATTKCNQKCIFCFERDIHFTKRDLSLNAIKRIIVKAKKDGFTYVNFIGGEITLVAWLPEAIRFIKKNNMKVGIVTNGTMLCNMNYTEKVIRAGLDHIEVSFHSHIPKDDYAITGLKAGLALRKEALHNISSLKKKYKGFFLCINIVVNALNFTYLREMIKKLQVYDFDYVDIKVLRITDNIRDIKIIPQFGHMKKYLTTLFSFLTKENIRFKFENIPLCCIPARYYLRSMELSHVVTNAAIGGHGFYYGNSRSGQIDFGTFSGRNGVLGKCAHCLIKKFCCRPQKEYRAIFGDVEFTPITNTDRIKKQLAQ